MDFTHTDERRMLQDTLSRYVRDEYPHATRMAIAQSATGISLEKYYELCELGVAGALLPECAGGYGGQGFDISVVFEELGRALVVEPFLGSIVLAGRLLAASSGSPAISALLPKLLTGESIAALAHSEAGSRYDLERVSTQARLQDGHWRLNGHKTLVLNADSASVLLVSARDSGEIHDEQGVSLFMLSPDLPGVTVNAYPTIDGFRSAEVTLQDVMPGKDSMVFAQGQAYEHIEKATAAGILALCAEAIGAMEVCKQMTIDYLQTRRQFGVPIGKFQVLQHRMVDVTMEIEQARSAVINAAGHLDADRLVRERMVSAAKNLVGRVARLVAEESIQLHGGIAMTWEYALAHYAKRLVMMDHYFGDTDHHLQRYARFSWHA